MRRQVHPVGWAVLGAALWAASALRLPAQIEFTGTDTPRGRKLAVPPTVAGGKGGYWAEAKLEKVVRPKPGPVLRPDVPALAYQEPSTREDDPKDVAYVRPLNVSVLAAGDITRGITAQTGVKVLLQANWMREKVILPTAPAPARELMDGLRRAFPGEWFKTDDLWILALGPAEAQMTLLTPEERAERSKAATGKVLKGLLPADWQLLLKNPQVPLNRLSLPTQRAIVEEMRLAYWDPERVDGVPTPAAMQGRLMISFSGQGQSAQIRVREVGRAVNQYAVGMPFFHPMTGEPLWGVRPPR